LTPIWLTVVPTPIMLLLVTRVKTPTKLVCSMRLISHCNCSVLLTHSHSSRNLHSVKDTALLLTPMLYPPLFPAMVWHLTATCSSVEFLFGTFSNQKSRCKSTTYRAYKSASALFLFSKLNYQQNFTHSRVTDSFNMWYTASMTLKMSL
jgi:hypothetical protein